MSEYEYIKPLSDLNESSSVRFFYENLQVWLEVKKELTDRNKDRSMLDLWVRERNREFAIGTGEIEGLYRLKRGITEQLITEGLDLVEASHTFENIQDETIRGLLRDQNDTLELIFTLVKDDVPLTHHEIRNLHQQVTRHQETANGRDIYGRPTQIPLLKGAYKRMPNNPSVGDGEVHHYCPPESTHVEMTKLLDWHREYEKDKKIGAVEHAAWLHYRFVQIHPFQDGNGRMARLIMSYVLAKHGAFPPIITIGNRDQYIDSLEESDGGNLQPFLDFVAAESASSIRGAVSIAKRILRGSRHYHHQNRGVTIDGVYYPPDSERVLLLDCPVIDENYERPKDSSDQPKGIGH